MKKMNFAVTIHAKPVTVWEVLWSDETYRQWTAPFGEGSRVESDFKEGSKALFLGDNGHGMVSQVIANRPYEFMSFRHLGEVKNGVEDTESEKVKAWAGAMEDYTLEENGEETILSVEIDVTENDAETMKKVFPEAFRKVKELAEEID